MAPNTDAINAALATVNDPEIHRPITELGMVASVDVEGGAVTVHLLLTVAGCPLKATLNRDITAAVGAVDGVTSIDVQMGVMSDQQRQELTQRLRGGTAEPENPFAKPDSRTQVYAVVSGKGGVGKSTVTVNLAAALASRGLAVGLVDADIYGFSVPGMLGVTEPATKVENMIMPPTAHGVRVISIGMFVADNSPVVWRGPMLHRALQQFLTDVYWGDLDVLLLDLPPGTGDMAISLAQLLPNAELLVVTTPQQAAAVVAERAGSIASRTNQRVAGVIENMSWLTLPTGERMEVFGAGGGQTVADALGEQLGVNVPVLGRVPLESAVREHADAGKPLVTAQPDSEAAKVYTSIAAQLADKRPSLVGRPLTVHPV